MALLAAASVTLALVLLGLLYICRTARKSSKNPIDTDVHQVPELPYWLPWLGHSLSLLANADHFVQKASQHSEHGIFALFILGSKWNVVAGERMCKSVLNHPQDVVDSAAPLESLLCRAFGADRRFWRQHRIRCRNIGIVSRVNVLSDRELGVLPQITRNTEFAVPNLISFSESLVDQHPWERVSHTIPLDAETVEANLFSLMRSFVGYTICSPLLGRDFMEIYPSILEDLWDFDAGFRYLLLGLPRLLPIKPLARARNARRRMRSAIDSFHRALDKEAVGEDLEAPWRDLHDICGTMRDRSSIYREEGIPSSVKGPLDLHFIWSMGTTITGLVFWLLIRLHDDPTLLDKVRSETAPFVRVTPPSGDFGIPEAPRLQSDIDGLIQSCKLVRACYRECVRLDASIVSLGRVQRDFILQEMPTNVPDDERLTSHMIKAGEYIAVPFALRCSDAAHFENPELFRPERFFMPGQELASLLPWCDDDLMPLDLRSVERPVLTIVVGVLALWELGPTEPGGCVVPKHQTSPNFMDPNRCFRVRVKRRARP